VMSGIWFSIDYRQIDGRIYSDEMLLIGWRDSTDKSTKASYNSVN
jgi:hypothetical protein